MLLFPPEAHPAADEMSKSFVQPPAQNSLFDVAIFTPDYAVVIVMAVFLFASISWVVSAKKWFTGPVHTVEMNQEKESSSKISN